MFKIFKILIAISIIIIGLFFLSITIEGESFKNIRLWVMFIGSVFVIWGSWYMDKIIFFPKRKNKS